jgi:hypothetical protein
MCQFSYVPLLIGIEAASTRELPGVIGTERADGRCRLGPGAQKIERCDLCLQAQGGEAEGLVASPVGVARLQQGGARITLPRRIFVEEGPR